jgi:hypothetical protein
VEAMSSISYIRGLRVGNVVQLKDSDRPYTIIEINEYGLGLLKILLDDGILYKECGENDIKKEFKKYES